MQCKLYNIYQMYTVSTRCTAVCINQIIKAQTVSIHVDVWREDQPPPITHMVVCIEIDVITTTEIHHLHIETLISSSIPSFPTTAYLTPCTQFLITSHNSLPLLKPPCSNPRQSTILCQFIYSFPHHQHT